ncbi:lipid II flippase MurJ [Polynucleobacter aenigmaticus]|uniref:lipid II flippase MurJ n=1 Tax=Polynucleobacter aenigmaticus TaxID=1743164 RepID=UPI0013747710|nr:lipid II flippase MurJ [Polynucleobacter aenigmaticus]
MAFIVALQLAATFSTQIIVVRFIGIGVQTDAFSAALTIPAVLSAILIAALQSVWLPRFSAESSNKELWRDNLKVALGQSMLLSGGIFILAVGTMQWWLHYIFPDFSIAQLSSAITLSSILSIASIFNVLSSILVIAFRSQSRFYKIEIIALLGTIFSLIALFYVIPIWGLVGVALITLGRSLIIFIIQMAFLGWPSISVGRGYKSCKTWRLMGPVFAGAIIYKTSPLVDRFWASQSSIGGLTLFNLAQMAVGALAIMLERSICVPIISRFGYYVANRDYKELKSSYRFGVFQITLISILFVFAMILLKDPFIEIIKFILNVNIDDASNIWWLCLLYVGYLHVSASGGLPVAVLYSLNDTKTPFIIGMIGFIASLFIKAFSFILFSLPGLVLATSIYYILNMAFMCWICERGINARNSQ